MKRKNVIRILIVTFIIKIIKIIISSIMITFLNTYIYFIYKQ